MDYKESIIVFLSVIGTITVVALPIIICFKKELLRWLFRPKHLDWCYKEDKEIRFLFIKEDADINKLDHSNLKSHQSDTYKTFGEDRIKHDSSDFFCYEKDIEKNKEFIKKDGHTLIKEIEEKEASYKKTLIFA